MEETFCCFFKAFCFIWSLVLFVAHGISQTPVQQAAVGNPQAFNAFREGLKIQHV